MSTFDDDSESYTHFLGGSPMNRVSWLRTSSHFLTTAAQSPNTRWLLFNAGGPLVSTRKINPQVTTESKSVKSLALLLTEDVKKALGETPYFGQGEKPGGTEPPKDLPVHVLEAARLRGPIIIFLGVLEPAGITFPLPAASQAKDEVDIVGDPYFALDVTSLPENEVVELIDGVVKRVGLDISYEFSEPRKAMGSFTPLEAAIFGEARSMVDWNSRNLYCPACGSKNYALWGGWKLNCSTLLPWADNVGKAPCPSGKGLQNFTHPRTDVAVITAVIDETGDRILLGRNKKFPGNVYSTLAGFIEPGESLEEAVQREIYEESGIRVKNVKYHSCQPWPYPANLMVGCYARADSSQVVRLDIDNELADARWFSREEVLAVLAHPNGTRFRIDSNKISNEQDQQATPTLSEAPAADPPFKVPPVTAIAGVLISRWAQGKAKL